MKSSPLKSVSVWLEALQGHRGSHESAKLWLPFLYTYSFLSCCNTGFSQGRLPTGKELKRQNLPGIDMGGAWGRTSSSSESRV